MTIIKRLFLLLTFLALSMEARLQILTLVDSVQLNNAQIWGNVSDDGDSLCITTTFSPGTKPHLYLRKTSYNNISSSTTPKQLTFDNDFTGITNLTDHKSIILNNEIYISFSTQQDKDLFLFKTDIYGNRIGSIVTVVQNSPDPTNDMILTTDSMFIYVLHFDPPFQHRVNKYDNNLNLVQQPFSTTVLNHNNLGNAIYQNNEFIMFTGTHFGFNAHLVLTRWDNSFSPTASSAQIIVSSTGGDGNWFSTGEVHDPLNKRWYIGMNHIYSNQTIGQEHIDLLVLDSTFNVIERKHVTADNYTRPHFVLKGNYLYMSFDRPGQGVYLHKYLIQQSNSITDLSSSAQMLVYPNPAHDEIKVIFNSFSKASSISFLNMYGQTLQQFDNDGSEKEIVIDLDSYPAGLYLMKSSTGSFSKIIKME